MEFIYGLIVSLIFGILAFLLKVISMSGLAGGVIFGTVIYGCTGWRGFAIPLVFVAIGSLCTKIGYARKSEMGIAQEEGGKRAAKHALANILGGALFAVAFRIFISDSTDHLSVLIALSLLTAMIGSYATAAADTSSSEMGQLFGKTPINPLTFKRVSPGTEGAISIEGTLFGVLGSFLVAITAVITGLVPYILRQTNLVDIQLQTFTLVMVISVVIGAFLGNMAESIIGAMGGKNLNNEFLNFMNTLIGGIISGLIFFTIKFTGWF